MSQPNEPYQPYQQSPWPPAAQAQGTVPPAPVSPPPSPSPKKRHRVRNTLLAFAGVLILIITLASIFGPGADSDTPKSAAAPATTTAPAAQATTPAVKAPVATSAPTKAAPKPAPVVYQKITDRQWKLIAKDPDAYAGKAYVVYGEVTQFDAATGADTFRADVGGAQRKPSYGYVDYPTNTVLSGDAEKLSKLVEGDLFRAQVLVGGSVSYDTQIGGNTTVPALIVSSIKVTGSTAS